MYRIAAPAQWPGSNVQNSLRRWNCSLDVEGFPSNCLGKKRGSMRATICNLLAFKYLSDSDRCFQSELAILVTSDRKSQSESLKFLIINGLKNVAQIEDVFLTIDRVRVQKSIFSGSR